MNLLEIILFYLEKPENKRKEYLNHLVEDCGMDPVLIPHIERCRDQTKLTHIGTFQLGEGETDVNIWNVECYFPELVIQRA